MCHDNEQIDPYSIAIDPATRFKQLIKMVKSITEGIRALITEKIEIMDKLKNSKSTYNAIRSIEGRKSRIEERMKAIADTIVALLDTKLVNTEQVSRIKEKFEAVTVAMGSFLEQTNAEVKKSDITNDAETTFSMIDILHRELEFYLQVDNRDVELKILDHVTIVFATLSITGRQLMRKMRPFTTLIIDEAAQVTESESMIPLDLVSCDNTCGRVVLIGDHKQLPSTVISNEAIAKNYAQSMFERLIQKSGLSYVMLDTQYRMHPLISAFPESQFYQRQLHDGANVLQYDKDPVWSIRYSHGLSPCAFVNCATVDGVTHSQQLEQFVPLVKSYGNESEADVVVKIIDNLVNKLKIPQSSISVITFYRGQVDLIRKKLAARFPEESEKQRIEIEQRIFKSRRITTELSGGIDVNTVDSYQGSEKEVCVLSTVRSNVNGNLGFLNDERRINVALTRAKYSLLIVGHGQTLATGSTLWKDLLKDVDIFEPEQLLKNICQIPSNDNNGASTIETEHDSTSVLELSIRRKDLQFVSALLKNNQFKNDTRGAILAAIDTDNSGLLKHLLEYKDRKQRLINEHDQSASDNNLLHRAVLFASINAAKVLIAKKPDMIFEMNNDGQLPLHLAASVGDTALFDLIFSAMKEHAGWQQKLEEQRSLIHPQQVNDITTLNKFCVQDHEGNTPLHIACEHGHKEIVAIMIKGRALNRLTNNAGKTATQIAQQNSPAIAKLLN